MLIFAAYLFQWLVRQCFQLGFLHIVANIKYSYVCVWVLIIVIDL